MYISLNGSAKSPTAPPNTCMLAASSIAFSGSNSVSASPVIPLNSTLKAWERATILLKPSIPFLKPYAAAVLIFSPMLLINCPAFIPNFAAVCRNFSDSF